jgi:hypothetical protein
VTAPAVVTAAHEITSMASGDGVMAGKATFWYRLQVEVRPTGQDPFDAEFDQDVDSRLGPGSKVAVIFDANDHSKICFDHEAPLEVSMPRLGGVTGSNLLTAMGDAADAGNLDDLHRLKAQFRAQQVDPRGTVVQGSASSPSGSGSAEDVTVCKRWRTSMPAAL